MEKDLENFEQNRVYEKEKISSDSSVKNLKEKDMKEDPEVEVNNME